VALALPISAQLDAPAAITAAAVLTQVPYVCVCMCVFVSVCVCVCVCVRLKVCLTLCQVLPHPSATLTSDGTVHLRSS